MSKIQNENIKSEAELIADGAAKSQLPNDDKVYLTANSLNKTLKEAIEDGDISGNAGNYIENPQAKVNTTGWVRYANTTPSDVPDNFGGTPNADFTWTRNTTNPLWDSGDFLLTKTANNRQSNGVYYQFDVQEGSKTLPHLFSCLKKDSSNYLDGYAKLYLVFSNDNFVADFFVVRAATDDLLAGTVDACKRFQFPTGYSKCRFCIHVATTTTTAWTINFDNFFLGLSPLATSAVVLDEKFYTPTFTGFGTPTNVEFYYSQVGDKLHISGKFTSGTNTATEARISLPSGLVSKTFTQGIRAAGSKSYIISASGNIVTPLIESGVSYLTFGIQSGSSAGLTKVLGNSLVSNQATSFHAEVPIQGWSSNAVSSIDLGTRSVVVKGASNAGGALTANVTNITFTEALDNTSSWSGTVFTSPENADYLLTGAVASTAANAGSIQAYVNGTYVRDLHIPVSGTPTRYKGLSSEIFTLSKNDTLSLRTTVGFTLEASAAAHYISISKIASPQTMFGAERMAMTVTATNGQSFTDATTTTVVMPTIIEDTHGKYNTSTGEYTVTRNGMAVGFGYGAIASVTANTGRIQMLVQKNIVTQAVESYGIGTIAQTGRVSFSFPVVAGDVIRLQLNQSNGATRSFTTSAGFNIFHLEIK